MDIYFVLHDRRSLLRYSYYQKRTRHSQDQAQPTRWILPPPPTTRDYRYSSSAPNHTGRLHGFFLRPQPHGPTTATPPSRTTSSPRPLLLSCGRDCSSCSCCSFFYCPDASYACCWTRNWGWRTTRKRRTFLAAVGPSTTPCDESRAAW